MKIEVSLATLDDKPLIQRMIEFYQYDFSGFDNRDLDSHGCYGYPLLDYYWTETTRHPFIVHVEMHLAGLALVNQHTYLPGNQWAVAEFFIMRKYRRQGIGKTVAFFIFDQFRGKW